jgi:hypothetical protein
MVKNAIISSAALAAALLLAAATCCPAANAFVAPTRNSPLVHHHPGSSSTFYNNHHQRSSSHQQTKSSSCRQQQMELSALLPSAKLTAIGMGVAKFYKASPLIAGFLTASTKAAFADSMAQYRDVCTTKFDVRRNIAMVLYSGTVLGMLCSIMYNKIFPLLFAGTDPLKLAVKMTLFDGFVNAPLIWLPPAYIAQALIYKYPKREAIQKYITDVKENGLLTKYWSVWIPCSFINFLFVPAHFRVAFVAAVSFFWMIILSLVANKSDDQDVDSCPVEPEPRMLAPAAFE